MRIAEACFLSTTGLAVGYILSFASIALLSRAGEYRETDSWENSGDGILYQKQHADETEYETERIGDEEDEMLLHFFTLHDYIRDSDESNLTVHTSYYTGEEEVDLELELDAESDVYSTFEGVSVPSDDEVWEYYANRGGIDFDAEEYGEHRGHDDFISNEATRIGADEIDFYIERETLAALNAHIAHKLDGINAQNDDNLNVHEEGIKQTKYNLQGVAGDSHRDFFRTVEEIWDVSGLQRTDRQGKASNSISVLDLEPAVHDLEEYDPRHMLDISHADLYSSSNVDENDFY
jgi:hypothetical protein